MDLYHEKIGEKQTESNGFYQITNAFEFLLSFELVSIWFCLLYDLQREH